MIRLVVSAAPDCHVRSRDGALGDRDQLCIEIGTVRDEYLGVNSWQTN
jgi:hypothetical protein